MANVVKKRVSPEENYMSFHDSESGKTLRLAIDGTSTIRELKYPEFYDVAINNMCLGRCDYCYADSKPNGKNFDDPVSKIRKFFGPMTENQRPFQVAIGGTGEPTMHPEFRDILREFFRLDITPNFTTNGMFVSNGGSDVFLDARDFCGGVAVSCHEHLWPYWTEAVEGFLDYNVKTNLHIIISDRKSVDDFSNTYAKYKDRIGYFVLLPYTSVGRAKKKSVDWPYLKAYIDKIGTDKIAFGANFYPYLKESGKDMGFSLYEPEIMSKFLSLDGNGALYKSSFAKTPVRTNLWEG